MQTTQEEKITLLENEIHMHNNTVYVLSTRARAARLVDNKQQEEACQKDIENSLKIIDFLKSELDILKKEVMPTNHEVVKT